MGEPRSQKQQREQLVRALRADGKSWVDVAEVLRQRYRVNPRVAFRYAHGWSQRGAADEWNRHWPGELKTFKTFSYWELWPSTTGHAPSFDSLSKLAELYQCAVSDLLSDLPDFRHCDAAAGPGKTTASLPAERTVDGDVLEWLRAVDPLMRRLPEVDFVELAREIVMWIQRFDPSVSRRELLFKLHAAFTVATTVPFIDLLDSGENEHPVSTIEDLSNFDEPIFLYCEKMTDNLRRQGDLLGPQFMIQSVMGYRSIAQRLAKLAPSEFQKRAISTYAELTQLVGWLSFNMGDYRSAQHYYDDARSAAHDAQNIELVTFILCSMSHLATWQGKPRVGLDHAVAAAVWAKQANSPLAQAYAADVAVRAYVADSQPDKFRETLDQEYEALNAVSPDIPAASWWYVCDESCYWRAVGECALKLHQPEAALSALDKSLSLVAPAHLHNNAFRLLFRAEARIQQVDIGEASRMIGDVARRTVVGRSQRIAQRINSLRGLLTPWERTKSVRELDKQLTSYGLALGNRGGNTKTAYSR